MKLFIEIVAVLFFGISYYFACYFGAFSACLSDDVEFRWGTKRMRNRRKKNKNFLKKFLFLDVKKEIVAWHYAMFWINLVTSVVWLISLCFYVVLKSEVSKIIFLVSFGISALTTAIILCIRWRLYAWNKVKNRRSYNDHSKKR